jgi:ABC-2 type transport system ATP-binding protein
MIEVKGIAKSYGDLQALDDVSFTVEKGQIVGFLGANGAGKTTAMDIICGVIGADTGSASIAGFDITEDPLLAKRGLGYLPDVPPLYPDMRVKDYITYAAKLHQMPRDQIADAVAKTLVRLSLVEVKDRLIGNLSKGFRQRVALAQAIIHSPAVLVLDEPTEGLDPNQIIQIRELIKSLAGDHTIILSSHILSEVQNTCEHIIIIDKGRIIQQGSYEDLIAQKDSGHLFSLKLRKNGKPLIGAIKGMPGILSVNPVDDFHIEFGVGPDLSLVDQVAKTAIDYGYGLAEMKEKTKSLEDVFIQLTH